MIAALVVAIATTVIVVCQAQHPTEKRSDDPVASVTSAPVATGAPTPTAAPPGEPMDGDDGGEAAAGCLNQPPGTACDDLLPPETISPEQVAATEKARSFVAAYVDYNTASGVAHWRERLSPYVASDSDLPLTAVARSRSALADLNASAKLDPALPVQAYPDGTDSSGSWRFTINATVTARYVDATGTASNWSIPGTWTVTMDPASGRVTDVDESTPLLDNAP
ncbi:hypothetical protein [Curtobacterium sp. 20TX0008]|uniref:hypothetical protein n=1 Tax=Curtobacterium sp. 20TX0008 TaxID=3022018 RepID=UPI00232CD143|nr:hypothetical protein [Curtobacterium sp. 20TX0008]MDB6425927.1 hypothetical protein [Curtobacterium sp. 20TX0008]